MALFQTTIIKKYTQGLNTKTVDDAYSLFKNYFLNPTIQENIREAKEEQFQEGFLRELFGNILGYALNPNPNFNLTTELKNTSNSKKVDGAILINNKAIAVIELKGTDTTDLAKIETQAFGYKNNQPHCTYVITSNFEKLRFYIDNTIEFIEFNLFTLNREDFNLLWLCLSLKNIEQHTPKKIKEESVSKEDTITKKLYKDYSDFKQAIFNSLVEHNKQIDKLLLFKKTQKLLDRFLFIFFAEDRLLLPANLIVSINFDWKKLQEMRVEQSLYDRYKIYFNDLNTGNSKLDIYSYNGGLFAPDEVLDNISIEDELLYNHTQKLSNYDFQSEVDVNILGHIFENSLNEIDKITSEIEGNAIDNAKTKRKKDGVFYTPKYITKYIVENTIGKLCAEKKENIQLIEEHYTNDKKKTTKLKKELLDKLNDYRNWLLQLTICDPACGSGAFLNQALDFLIAEHRYIDELQAKLLGASMILSDIENSILENNLFGVDINEESVEIAQLSLWLRTAQRNRKLNSLSNNIKCGNSLIDDPTVAVTKAFNWQKEFPQVFAKGGFDVVIGNPPYVFARDNFKQIEKDYFIAKYISAKYQINTYLLFIEQAVNILNDNGNYGLIIPNAWLMVYSGEGLRKFLLDNCKLNQIINLSGYSFEAANVETVILIADKKKENLTNVINIYLNNGTEFYLSHSKNQRDFENNTGFEFKVFLDDENDGLNSKIVDNSVLLDNIVEIKAGLQAYENDKGEPKQTAEDVINRPYDYNYKFDEQTYKYLDGKDVGRYYTNWSGLYLRYGKHLAAPRTFNLFEGKKIIVREITGNYPKCIVSTYSEDIYLYNRSNIAIIEKEGSNIALKYILSLLNSSLLSYYFLKNTAKSVRKLFPKIILNDLRKFPLKNIPFHEQQPFIEMADLMLSLNKELQDVSSKFQRTLERKYNLGDLPKKLQDWYLLNYADFLKELGKKKIKLSLSDEAEWEDYFLQESKKAKELKSKIDATNKKIDQMVYKLYDLTEEEIIIVEGK